MKETVVGLLAFVGVGIAIGIGAAIGCRTTNKICNDVFGKANLGVIKIDFPDDKKES